jgi:hypothetical protein
MHGHLPFQCSQARRHNRRRLWFWVEVHLNLEAEFGRWEVELQQSGMSNWREIMAPVFEILLYLVPYVPLLTQCMFSIF